jgi:hypothetical protein
MTISCSKERAIKRLKLMNPDISRLMRETFGKALREQESLRAFARASSGRIFSFFPPKDCAAARISVCMLHLYLL